ncbi:MAG: UvrD-helicase domain-containing protein, partial [Clostridia bacterium]|nr:UvrD-helicase domain-containing protein [Clostridia bacterium]
MKLTREQNDAVKARGNVLVSAAAGSGKTAVLTQRVIDRVLNGDNPIDIDRLLVVTFTNASAAEMRKRISDALQKVIDEDKENIRAAKQKMLLESASICTTDSFCNNLVRENFTQLDIKPDFNIAASSQLALFSDSAMNEVIDGYYANDDEDFFKLLDMLGADEDERRFKEAVISIFNFTRTLPYPDKWLNEIEKQYTDFSFERSIWKDIVLEECKETAEIWYLKVNSLFEEFDNFIGLGNTFDIFSYCREFFKTVNQLAENGQWDSIITACDCYSVPNIKVEKGCDEEAKERLKTEKGNIGKIVKAIKAKLIDSSGELDKQISENSSHISKLIEVVRRYSENLLKIKKEKNLFDFS